MSRLLTIFLLFLAPIVLTGQNAAECAADEVREKFFAKHPLALHPWDKLNAKALKFFQQQQAAASLTEGQMADFTIPLVVHIIHQNGPENIPDSKVLEAIQHLNDGFANAGYYAQGNGADVGIQFCLAQQDPDGNLTTGITRTESPLTHTTLDLDDSLKNLIRWNTLDYLNIWVVSTIDGGWTLGYANFPYSHGFDDDGIVVDDQIMGYNGSKTLLHEAGHYLALFHTFNNGCDNNDCLISGDQVCDTPPDNTTIAPVNCNNPVNSCSTDALSGFTTDQNDINWNYLDYGNSHCRNGFTEGQAEWMRYYLENGRASLLSSKGCQFPCLDPLTASFTASATTVDIGSTVYFTNTSTNATNYVWTVDGALFSTGVDPWRIFNAVGTYEVKLTASNGDSLCTETFTTLIEVICSVEANFTVSDLTPLAGSTLTTFNLSDPGFNQWYFNGSLISTLTNTSFLLPNLGEYKITLVVENYAETCKDTFSMTLETVCLDAAFGVSSFYPEPGELVNFINTSQGTASYTWTVNGSPVSTSEDMGYAFPSEGSYTVCLQGETPFCSDQFCNSVFVYEKSDQGCDGTFLKRISSFDISQMLPVPGDDFLFAGSRAEAGLLARISSTGETVSAKDFDITVYRDHFTKMILDSDNNLLLSGHSYSLSNGSVQGFFILKYDYQNDTTLWVRTFPEEYEVTDIGILMEKEPGGNFQAFGQVATDNPFVVDGNQRFVMELDRHTGEIISIKQAGTAFGRFEAGIQHNGAIYTIGNNSNNPALRKAALSKFDLEGNHLWTNTYFNPVGESAASGFTRMLVENDTLLTVGFANFTNLTSSDFVMVFTKMNLDGELLWAKQYEYVGTSQMNIGSFLSLPDGYLITGSVLAGTANPYHDEAFHLRLDKQGNVVWSKGKFIFTTHATIQDGYLYFSNSNFRFGKMTLDGEITGPICALGNMEVVMSDLPIEYFYSEVYTMMQDTLDLPSDAVMPISQAINLTNHYVSGCICTEPVDSCLLATDALLTSVTAERQCDSLLVTLKIYNNSIGDLLEGTPVAFYQGNPTTGAANLLNVQPLPDTILYTTSRTFSFTLPSLFNTPIFVVVNDNASTPAPWPLDSFPNGSLVECFFQNNIGSFQVNYTASLLDLGADTAICDFGTATFYATPGFVDYTWQDGSKETSFTAWLPGDYWVEAVDNCGNVQTDTVTLTVNPITVANIGDDTLRVCAGEQVTFNVPGFDHYEWSPSNGLSCDTCGSVTVIPSIGIQYQLTVSTDEGCYSSDSVWVEMYPPVMHTSETFYLCEGESIQIGKAVITGPDTLVFTFANENGCDSTHTIIVIGVDTSLMEENISICPGDSALVFGDWITQPGTYQQIFTAANGCDSTHIINVLELDAFLVEESTSICYGDSALIFGNWTAQPGTYQETFTAVNGCDSTYIVELIVNAEINMEVETNASINGLPNGSITLETGGGTAPFHYNWDIPGAGNTPFVGGLVPGIYSVTVTDAAGCSIVSQIEVQLSTATQEKDLGIRQLLIGPNPSSGIFKVEVLLEQAAEINFEIIDISGRILEKASTISATEKTWVVDVTHYPAAMYACRVWIGGRMVVRTFIKL